MPVESAFIYDIKLLHLWYLNYNTIAMTNVNYALLAALVDEQEATLFDESFAHIIGYSISELAESKEGTCFYKTTDVRLGRQVSGRVLFRKHMTYSRR